MKLLSDEELKEIQVSSYMRGARDILSNVKNFIDNFEKSIINDMERKILNEIQTREKDR